MSKRKGAGIFVIKDKSILLLQRQDNDFWELPGGESQFQESPEATARRKLREETGLKVDQVESLKILSGPAHRQTYPNGTVIDWTMVIFVAQYHAGEPMAGDGINTVQWWPLDALPAEISEVTGSYFKVLKEKMTL